MLTLILALRFVSFAAACYNVNWSIRGASALSYGRWTPPNIYLAVVFLSAVSVIAFFGGWVANPARSREIDHAVTAWRLFAYVLLAAGQIVAAMGQRAGVAVKAKSFYGLYDNLDEALAISELARVDKGAAKQMAEECRRRMAEAVIRVAS